MPIDVNSRAYEARYAADVRHEWRVDAVAKAMYEDRNGPGTWDRATRWPCSQADIYRRMARVALDKINDL